MFNCTKFYNYLFKFSTKKLYISLILTNFVALVKLKLVAIQTTLVRM